MGGVIAGQVKDPDGKPVAAAQVCAFQQMGPNGYQSLSPELTGKDGRYTIRGVPPGNWSLSAAPPAGSRLVLQGLPARAVAAGKTETVDVALQPGASIVGRVVTDKGRPVAGASVSLQSGRGNLSHMPGMEGHDRDAALTDASGTFRIDGLWPGTHKIQCSAPDPVLRIEPADVKVEGAGEQKTEIVARATGSLRGTVLDAAGKPVGSEFLRLHLEQPAAAAGGQPLQLTLYPSAEGQFRQSHVYADTYRLVVTVTKKGEEKGLVAPPPAEIEIKEAAETKTEVTIGAK
jgi:protocatechuate 3,4-dioxygenase beta subunit